MKEARYFYVPDASEQQELPQEEAAKGPALKEAYARSFPHGLCVLGATRQGWEDQRAQEVPSGTRLPASRGRCPAPAGRHL